MKHLSHHHADYAVGLEAKALNFTSFIERLGLGANSGGKRVGLGGDGRNNQILVSLWKAKSEMEHDLENEVVIYCIEEPEAHLHPHQQRKLANYLVNELGGQVLVSTHSPQIASEFRPDGIVRLHERHGGSVAAREGCSSYLKEAWLALGYRMSIIPAEAFFADAVLLVEGPSEVLLYHALARQLGIDLDFYNVSILQVGGVDFEVFVAILNALDIPWSLRTDNDITKVPKSKPTKWRFTGLNRAQRVVGGKPYQDSATAVSPETRAAMWQDASPGLNAKGIFVSRVDLENDLAAVRGAALEKCWGTESVEEAIEILQGKKALRMGVFLAKCTADLKGLGDDPLAAPLMHTVKLATQRRQLAREEPNA